MRFVIAIVLFVAAFFAIGLGIAQRTVLAGPESFSTAVTTGTAPITVVEGDALNALPGTQTVTVTGGGDIFLAYGRTGDVLAWVDDLPYNHVTFEQGATDFTTETVGSPATVDPTPGATPTPTPTATTGAGDEEPAGFTGDVPDPRAADVWVQEFEGTDQLIRRINAPQDISLIIMSDGVSPAPSEITVTWPLDNSAPYSGALIIGGILALLAGLAAFLWALVHARRRRGPRRKQLPRAPQPKRLKRAPKRAALPAGSSTVSLPPPAPVGGPEPTRRGRRRSIAAVGGILTASLLLAGCTTGGGVLGSGLAPTPAPSSSDVATENGLKPPAVTKQQLGRIVDKIAETVAAADKAKDPTLAATRLAGPALALRAANYTITTNDPALATLPAFPSGTVEVVLPQQNDEWARSVFAIIQPTDTTLAPVALMLVQDSPRENYKVHYLITLEPGFALPPVAPAQIGSPSLDADNGFGLLAPNALAQAYGDVLTVGPEATHFDLFQEDGDTLRVDIGFEAKQARAATVASQGSAKIAFTNGPNVEAPISFPTNDSGQIVAVALDDTETITPTEAGAAINSPPAVKALSGSARSTKGITATYGVQLLFYVPKSPSTQQIQLLGFSQGLVAAKEVN